MGRRCRAVHARREEAARVTLHHSRRAVPFIPERRRRCVCCFDCGRALLLGVEFLWRRGRPRRAQGVLHTLVDEINIAN